MKKILILLVLAVFAASLAPSVMAQNSDRPEVMPVQIQDRANITAVKEVIAEAISETNASGPVLITALQRMNAEQIRNFQQEKLQVAIQMCEDSVECQEKLETRLQLVERLGDQDLERLNRIEQKKQDIIQKIRGIYQNPNFAKYMERGTSFVARALSGVDVEAAREMFQKAKGLYEDAVQGYRNSMGDFNQTREQLMLCQENQTDCEALEEQVRLRAQDVLNNTIESVIQHMEKVRASIMESETLSEEEASELLVRIEARLGELETLRTRVQAMDMNTTKEEIQNLTREMKQLWAEDVKGLAERAAGFVQTSRMGGITIQLNHLEQKLTDIMARMVELGKDITAVEPLVEEFNSYLDAAELSYNTAADKFKEASGLTGDARSAAISEAQAAMSEAKSSLREAHDILTDIVQEMASQTASGELEDDESYEELASVEEELSEEEV